MKKTLLSACLLSATMLLTACTQTDSTVTDEQVDTQVSTEKLSIVATSFHEYDWLREIIGDQDSFELSLLMNNGVDLHSYEPSVADIALISNADLYVYNGGISDTWVDDIIQAPINPDFKTVNVSEVLGDAVKMEVAVEGMQSTASAHDHDEEVATTDDHDHDEEVATTDDHDHDEEVATTDEHDHDEEVATTDEHDHDEETESHSHEDEHVWLSLNNAMTICESLISELSALDPDNAQIYQDNGTAYIQTLQELDDSYQLMVDSAVRDTVLFTDRFPFLYMMTDYGINYFAAFQGCSAETEASFETMVFLAEKSNELDVNYVLIIDDGLLDLGTTVIANSDDSERAVLTLNSIQSMSQEQIDAGATYYSIMEENLEVLTLALSE